MKPFDEVAALVAHFGEQLAVAVQEQALTIETRHGNRELNMWSFTQTALALLENGSVRL